MRLALFVRPGLIADLSGSGVNPGDSTDCRCQEYSAYTNLQIYLGAIPSGA